MNPRLRNGLLFFTLTSFLYTFPAIAASSAPGKDNQEHANMFSKRFEKADDRDVAKSLYRAEVILVGILESVTSQHAGMGALPMQVIQIGFKDTKILKGPKLTQKTFLYTKPFSTLKRFPRNSRVLATLKADTSSGGYLLDEVFKATPENMSLVPESGQAG